MSNRLLTFETRSTNGAFGLLNPSKSKSKFGQIYAALMFLTSHISSQQLNTALLPLIIDNNATKANRFPSVGRAICVSTFGCKNLIYFSFTQRCVLNLILVCFHFVSVFPPCFVFLLPSSFVSYFPFFPVLASLFCYRLLIIASSFCFFVSSLH